MARLGLPSFHLLQDPLDYFAVVHHSSADTFDHVYPADLEQAATVLAWLLWKAAEATDPLPNGIPAYAVPGASSKPRVP
jgi:hypothetical protein